MKKIISLVLVLTLSMTVFVGCGEKEKATNEAAKTEETKSNGTETVEKEEPVKIEWIAYNPDAEPDNNAEVIKYVEDKFNVDLNVWFMARENIDETLNIRIAGGDMPDIFKPKSGSLGSYVKQGVAGEVPKETIAKYAPNLYNLYEELYPDGEIWVRSMYKGKNYGYTSFNTFGNFPSLVVWRKDWLEKFGYTEAPVTLDEYEEVLYKFAKEDPDGNGKDDTYGMSDFSFNMVFGAYGMGQLSSMDWFGTNRVIKDGLPTFACIQPETKQALATLADWYQKGIIDPEFVTSEHTTGHWAVSNAFLNGRIGLTGRANPGHWKKRADGTREKVEQLKVNNDKAEVLFAKPPVGPTGLSGTNCDGNIGSNYILTTKATENPKVVQKLLEMADALVTDKEYYRMLSMGIEGEHYEFVDMDGFQVMDPTLPEGVNAKTFGLGVLSNITSPAIDQSIYEYQVSDFKELTAGREQGDWQPKVPSTDAYSQYAADLRRIAAEAFIQIVTGDKPLDYFDEFVEIYLANGGQETIDQMQAAYAEALGK